jgi:uncharacterized membrane protein
MSVREIWNRANESLWFIPSVMTIAAAAAALSIVALDRHVVDAEFAGEMWFIYDVGSDGARATLGAIAQSVMTVTGVVFSVTIVALQLAASQFTPRVLRTFLTDTSNKLVLGIFIGTFTYTLLVVRTVGSPVGEDDAFVPKIAVTVSILLMLVSIGALIFFVNHIAQSIRASVIVHNVSQDALRLVEKLFPEQIGEAGDAPGDRHAPRGVGQPDWTIPARRGGYLQFVNEGSLFALADEGRFLLELVPMIGHYVLPGEPLVRVWFDDPARGSAGREELAEKIYGGLSVGDEWTLRQDLERALVELSDIAVRALSPSLNDPTTATMCVDHLGEILTRRGTRSDPSPNRLDESGRVRLVARHFPWDRAVEVSFEKIRHYAENSPSVLIRVVEVCGRIRRLVEEPRRPALEQQIRLAVATARRSLGSETEVERVENAASEAFGPALVGSGTAPS